MMSLGNVFLFSSLFPYLDRNTSKYPLKHELYPPDTCYLQDDMSQKYITIDQILGKMKGT